MLAVVAAVGYYGNEVGQIYWRYYRYVDALREEARFSEQMLDEDIIAHLHLVADTLDLPAAARTIDIRRSPHHVRLSASYSEHWNAPYFGRDFDFEPTAETEF
jgi:hypothetical protein